MISTFQENRDIYSTIASLAFNLPYESCLEFHPVTGEYQPEGKAIRGQAKVLVLGITYGMSPQSISEKLYGDKEPANVKKAQKVYDSMMNGFPTLKRFIASAEHNARKLGYTETILGRRRHIPEVQLDDFEFVPMKGYINPYFDPLDPNTLEQADKIPEEIITNLKVEFSKYRFYSEITRRTKELYEQHIKVINNRKKIQDGNRQVMNSIVQGGQYCPYTLNSITQRCA